MSVKFALIQESDVITEKPIDIPFEFKNVPDGRDVGDSIVIRPITVRTWFAMKPLLAMIDEKDFNHLVEKESSDNKDLFDDDAKKMMMKYDEIVFEIVCLGIHNKRGAMPEWFRQVLKDNCTWEDIYILLNAILFRLQSMSFSKSITVLKAVSPLREREIIALQENEEKWIRKAATHSSSQQTRRSDTPTNRR